MLGALACCWQACRVGTVQGSPAGRGSPAGWRAAVAGATAGLTALTRSSLSLLPLALAAAGLLAWRRRTPVAFVLPVLLLQGGWAMKNWVAPVWNLPSVAAASDAWRAAVLRFTWAHPRLFAERFAEGYRLLWQRIADHSFQFPWNLLYVEPVNRPWPGLLSRGFKEHDRIAVKAVGLTAQPGRKAWFGTISLAPLDAISIATLHVLLPVMLALDGWQRWRGRATFLPRGTLVLLAAVGHGLVLFSVGEGGENMRFRLAIEPEMIALVSCTLAGVVRVCSRKQVGLF